MTGEAVISDETEPTVTTVRRPTDDGTDVSGLDAPPTSGKHF
jgi:hypothetical protein